MASPQHKKDDPPLCTDGADAGPHNRRLAVIAATVLLLALLLWHRGSASSESSGGGPSLGQRGRKAGAGGGIGSGGGGAHTCPVHYERHSWRQLESGDRFPWLFGGAYRNDGSHFCVNCRRGGLWPTWCGRRPTGIANGWDLPQCGPGQVDSIVAEVAVHKDVRNSLRMTPCDLFQSVRGRTLWVIGDSQSKSLVRALKCFMVEFWPDLKQRAITNNYTAMAVLGGLPHSSPGRGGPHCIHLLQGTRICQIMSIYGDLLTNTTRAPSAVLPMLHRHLAHKDDIFVMNFGLWHPDWDRKVYEEYMRQLGEYYRANKKRFPHMFFMETPKQHFETPNGDFKSDWLKQKGKKLANFTCQPIANVTYNPDGSLSAAGDDPVAQEVAAGGWRNQLARRVLRDHYQMPLVPIYNVSVPFWNVHSHNYLGLECSHFCYPGVQHIWIHVLHRTLRGAVTPLPPPGPSRSQHGGGSSGGGSGALAGSKQQQQQQQQQDEKEKLYGCAEIQETPGQEALGEPKPASDILPELEEWQTQRLKQQHGALWWLFAPRRR